MPFPPVTVATEAYAKDILDTLYKLPRNIDFIRAAQIVAQIAYGDVR